MEDGRYAVSIKGVVFNEPDRVILLLNERQEWELPGGRIERGESPAECVVREFKEELDIAISPAVLLDTYLFEVIPRKHVFIVTYGCQLAGVFCPKISEEHLQACTFDVNVLPVNLPEGYRNSILTWHSQRTRA
ncbi:8-oxo-dGTP pyrophosphatase MutT (NUDIX family) [Paraburkholderia sp. GAS38]|jgi:8-oxo-dGTP pyrophosphatase MutT (NUDIX family)|uniref:NUDIX hydrolase n=1 Tax=Paraburkholderia sp. GAS38 TaxID=3035133 RepID=UPI003D1FCA88